MDNKNICTNCSTLNTLDSLFCKHCGKAINSTLNNRINDEIDSLINVKKEQLEKLAENLENRIELNSIKKIDGWIRTGGMVGAIFTIAGGLTAWGILTDKIKETTDHATQANIQIADLVNDTKDEMKKLENSKKEVDDKISSITNKAEIAATEIDIVNNATKDAKETTEEFKKLKENTDNDVAQVKKELFTLKKELINKIQRTDNATFNLFIDHGGNKHNQGFNEVMEKLLNSGFRINENNVIDSVSIDQNEITYFSNSSEEKAKEIKEILSPLYKDIKLHLKSPSDRDPSDMLLNLKERT